jgi:hypothetical protein
MLDFQVIEMTQDVERGRRAAQATPQTARQAAMAARRTARRGGGLLRLLRLRRRADRTASAPWESMAARR